MQRFLGFLLALVCIFNSQLDSYAAWTQVATKDTNTKYPSSIYVDYDNAVCYGNGVCRIYEATTTSGGSDYRTQEYSCLHHYYVILDAKYASGFQAKARSEAELGIKNFVYPKTYQDLVERTICHGQKGFIPLKP